MSLSARRAWIEICGFFISYDYIIRVALRKESVDRNLKRSKTMKNRRVALRKESVDRNYYADKDADWVRVSLSARRAWIEMPGNCCHSRRQRRRSPQGERG